MSRIANGAKLSKRKKWLHKPSYMSLYMPRRRAAESGNRPAYEAADAALEEAFPNRYRKPLMSAKRAARK